MKAYPVTALCRALQVSRSGFYDYLRYREQRAKPDPAELRIELRTRELFKKSKKTYGSRRLLHALRGEGYAIGRFKVRRLMRDLGLHAKTPKRYRGTTDSNHTFPVAPNRLNRQFAVPERDSVWTADVTQGAPVVREA